MGQTSHPGILLALHTAHLVASLLRETALLNPWPPEPHVGPLLDLTPRLGPVEMNRCPKPFRGAWGLWPGLFMNAVARPKPAGAFASKADGGVPAVVEKAERENAAGRENGTT